MTTVRLFLCGLVFATASLVSAQTNAPDETEKAPRPMTEIPHNASGGPVIMPPADQAPPAPEATPVPEASPPAPAPTAPETTPAPQPGPPSPSVQIPTPPGATSATPQQQEEIYDIRPPLFYLRSWFWLWIALAIVGLVALVVLLWSWFRTHAEAKVRTAYELALEKLENARALMNESAPEPYAVAVSEILRTYLGQRFQARSSRLTTQEFLRDMQSDTATPLAEYRDLLGDFLQACDLVKFAKYQPRLSELEQVQQSAVTFVTATKPVPVTGRQNGARP